MTGSWVGRLARFGLACRGAVYLVIAALAVKVAQGRAGGGQPDTRGALETIAHHPFGRALVLAIGVGFGCLAAWQAVLAAHDWPGATVGRRVVAAGKALIDAVLCISALAIAAHHQAVAGAGGDKQAVDLTGRIMRHTAGRFVVGAVGLGIGIAGVALIAKGLQKNYDVEVQIQDVPRSVRHLFEAIGGVGMFARGAIVALAGYFVVQAAVTFNPSHARGLDGVLASLVHHRWGSWLLLATAVGLACFGLFSLLEARYARTDPIRFRRRHRQGV